MTTVACVDCRNFTLKDARLASDAARLKTRTEMTRAGFGSCAVGPAYWFVSPIKQRTCSSHVAVAPEDRPARILWLRKTCCSTLCHPEEDRCSITEDGRCPVMP